jgi:hypothetical protein
MAARRWDVLSDIREVSPGGGLDFHRSLPPSESD